MPKCERCGAEVKELYSWRRKKLCYPCYLLVQQQERLERLMRAANSGNQTRLSDWFDR